MIEVSTHSKYIIEKDLLEWENCLKEDFLVKRLNKYVFLFPEKVKNDNNKKTLTNNY